MRKIIIGAFFALSLHVGFAGNIDSIKKELQGLSGTALENALCKASRQLIENGDLRNAQALNEDAKKNAQQSNNQETMASVFENFGLICQAKNDYSNALKYLFDAQRLRDVTKNHKAIANTKNMIGRVFLQQNDYSNALQQFTKAAEYWAAERDENGMAETSKLMGDTYTGMKVFGKAKDNYQKAMDVWIAQEQHQKAADIASCLGKIVTELADYDGALTYYQTSLDLNTTTNNLPKIAQDLRAMSKIHLHQGNYDEAKHFGESSMRAGEEMKDTLSQAQSAILLAMLANATNQKGEAEGMLQKSTNLLNIMALCQGVDVAYADIAAAYKEMGNLAKAYEYQMAFAKAKDGIAILDKNKTMMELTARYESEFDAKQKQQQIELLELEKANGQKTIWLLIALALGAIGIGFLMYRNYRQKKQDNQLLQVKNDEIVAINETLDSKNALLQEQQERVENMNEMLRHEMAEREAVEKNSYDRDSFLVNISNQMRSPLNIISGLSHLLLDQSPMSSQVEHLRTLQFSANSLMVFINDILDFSKIEAGKLNADTREFETTKLMLEIMERFKLPATNKGLIFNFKPNEGIPNKLIGDPARFNQILTNILTYSLQNTQYGAIDVKIEPIPLSGKGMHLEILVTDTSPGIPQFRMDDLLRKFSYSGNENLDTSQSSFGLGIMKRLVELQNGTVEASSIEGLGNKFRIVLPFKLTETKVFSLQDYDTMYSFPGSKILVVEDNKINQMVVVKMLQKAFTKVTTANNGLEAIARVEQEDFDLILMDIQMPEMDGYRATSEIRKMNSEVKRATPIIALTASPYLSETEKAQLFGMNDYIGKPFSNDELMEKVSKFLVIKEQSAAV